MTGKTLVVGIFIIATVIIGIMFVAFGQVTVRKLRKNPITKNALGAEFLSGWNIINVAQTLAFPRSWSRKLEQSPIGSMYANSDLLYENTNKFDRFLGAVFYWPFITFGLSGAFLVLLNALGVFD